MRFRQSLSNLLELELWVKHYTSRYSGFSQSWKVLEFQGNSLKSPWIPFFLENSLHFCASPSKVLEFSSTLNVVARKEFFDAFWLSKTEYKSYLSECKGHLHKVLLFYAIINYQFKTSELKNVENLVKQTVKALKSY